MGGLALGLGLVGCCSMASWVLVKPHKNHYVQSKYWRCSVCKSASYTKIQVSLDQPVAFCIGLLSHNEVKAVPHS